MTAADDWGGPAERKRVRPALRDSHERLLHGVDEKAFWIAIGQAPAKAVEVLRSPRLERAIGKLEQREAALQEELAARSAALAREHRSELASEERTERAGGRAANAPDYARVAEVDARLREVRTEREAAEAAWLELAERLVAHVQKEEMSLLPALEDLVDEEADGELAAAYAS